ncbi:MAG: hypothetical protein IPJ81_16315 [Chitinophagaceae bacterium]|nr:hypothetical protein [Chitinophagaceae bacterium]
MIPQKIINEVIELQAWAMVFNEKATRLRSELERFYAPAPKRGKKKILSAQQEAALITKRRQSILKANKNKF